MRVYRAQGSAPEKVTSGREEACSERASKLMGGVPRPLGRQGCSFGLNKHTRKYCKLNCLVLTLSGGMVAPSCTRSWNFTANCTPVASTPSTRSPMILEDCSNCDIVASFPEAAEQHVEGDTFLVRTRLQSEEYAGSRRGPRSGVHLWRVPCTPGVWTSFVTFCTA